MELAMRLKKVNLEWETPYRVVVYLITAPTTDVGTDNGNDSDKNTSVDESNSIVDKLRIAY